MIFYSLQILQCISFSSTVWDSCGETYINQLNSLHRLAAKLLISDENSSTNEKPKAHSILPLQKHLDFNKAVLMCNVNKQLVPSYMIYLFRDSNNIPDRYTLAKPRIDLYETSLSFTGSSCWNSPPAAIKTEFVYMS